MKAHHHHMSKYVYMSMTRRRKLSLFAIVILIWSSVVGHLVVSNWSFWMGSLCEENILHISGSFFSPCLTLCGCLMIHIISIVALLLFLHLSSYIWHYWDGLWLVTKWNVWEFQKYSSVTKSKFRNTNWQKLAQYAAQIYENIQIEL